MQDAKVLVFCHGNFYYICKFFGVLCLSMLSPVASQFAYQVKAGVSKTLAEVCAWSLQHAASGKAPWVGFYGELFNPASSRATWAGKELAKGYRLGAPIKAKPKVGQSWCSAKKCMFR